MLWSFWAYRMQTPIKSVRSSFKEHKFEALVTDPKNINEETRVPSEHSNRSGFIGLLGLPNAGKSTLMNGALQVKLSIVSNKPQTTRHRILGVVNAPNLQVALVDTPGIHRARGRMHSAMVQVAKDTVEDVDALSGTLVGNAKSAYFRTQDVVGLQ